MSLRDKINAGRQALEAGVRAVSAHDLFPTPPAVADRVAEYLDLFDGCRVLEPSAGTGELVSAIKRVYRTASVATVEQNADLADHVGAVWADFLELEPDDRIPGLFDRVAMNPPFSKGADIRHVRHALRFLKPGGVLVAIVADGPRQAEAFADAEDLERLPSGTFAGTGVRSRIVRIRT